VRDQHHERMTIVKQDSVNSCSSSGPIMVEEHDESQCQAMVSATRCVDCNRSLVDNEDNEAQSPEIKFQDSPEQASKPI